jgi:F-type H+-transporting ATPase subunit a
MNEKRMKLLINILVLLSLLVAEPAWAQTEESVAEAEAVEATIEASEEQEALDVKQIVLSHIGDSYEWHICSVGERHVSVPLPVIVRSESGKWHCFSSSRLHHGHAYEGFSIAEEGKYAGKIVEQTADGEQIRPIDLSITKTVAGLFVNCAV